MTQGRSEARGPGQARHCSPGPRVQGRTGEADPAQPLPAPPSKLGSQTCTLGRRPRTGRGAAKAWSRR